MSTGPLTHDWNDGLSKRIKMMLSGWKGTSFAEINTTRLNRHFFTLRNSWNFQSGHQLTLFWCLANVEFSFIFSPYHFVPLEFGLIQQVFTKLQRFDR